MVVTFCSSACVVFDARAGVVFAGRFAATTSLLRMATVVSLTSCHSSPLSASSVCKACRQVCMPLTADACLPFTSSGEYTICNLLCVANRLSASPRLLAGMSYCWGASSIARCCANTALDDASADNATNIATHKRRRAGVPRFTQPVIGQSFISTPIEQVSGRRYHRRSMEPGRRKPVMQAGADNPTAIVGSGRFPACSGAVRRGWPSRIPKQARRTSGRRP